MDEQRLLIVLYGKKNQGKTTTLKELILLLANSGIISPKLSTSLYKLFPHKGKNKDGRFILEINKKRILIATAGDSWTISRGNVEFFESKYKLSMRIYRVTSSSIYELSIKEKEDYKNEKADVCICACRPSGDSTGAIKALHMYCEEAIAHNYTYQLWVQKNSLKNDSTLAKELYDLVDTFIKTGKI